MDQEFELLYARLVLHFLHKLYAMFLYYSSSFARPLSLILSRLLSILYLSLILNMAEVENNGLFNCCSISVANTASFSAAALDICPVSHPFDALAFPFGILRGIFIQA